MAATLNIAALARRTGVQPDTIRKWEQRYGVLHPERTPGGQRRYSELDVSRVQWLKARLEEGYRIGEAAAILGQGEPPTGNVAEQREGLAEAAHAGDGERVGRILEHVLRIAPLAEVVDELLEPVLRELGERWAAGEGFVAHEHLVSHAIRAHVGSQIADARGGVRGLAVLASGPGDHHDLGVLVLALLLHRDGWQVCFLGAALPLVDAIAFAQETEAKLVAISVTMSETLRSFERELRATTLPDSIDVVVGGQGLNGDRPPAGSGVRYVTGSARAALASLPRRHT